MTASEANGAPEASWGDTFFYDPEGDLPHSGQRSRRRHSATSTTTRSGSNTTFLTHTPFRPRSLENAAVTRTLSFPCKPHDLHSQQPAGRGRRRVSNQRATCEDFLNLRKTCSTAQTDARTRYIDAESTGNDGGGFLELSGSSEDSDAPQVPSETRRQVIDCARAGTRVAQLAVMFGMSAGAIATYTWLEQERSIAARSMA